MLKATSDHMKGEEQAWTAAHSAFKSLTEKEREVCQLQQELLFEISRNTELERKLFQKAEIIKSLEAKCLRQHSAPIPNVSQAGSASIQKGPRVASAISSIVSKNEGAFVKQRMAKSKTSPTMPCGWESGMPSSGSTDTQCEVRVEVAMPKPSPFNRLPSNEPLPLQPSVIKADKTPLSSVATKKTSPATTLQLVSVRKPAVAFV